MRDYRLAIQLAEHSCELTDWKNAKFRHTLAMAQANYATDLLNQGKLADAIEHLRQAIEADADFEAPLFNLAILLSTSGGGRLLRPDEPVALAKRACGLAGQPDLQRLSILATAYTAAGRLENARATLVKAIDLAQSAGQQQVTERLRRQLSALPIQKTTPVSP